FVLAVFPKRSCESRREDHRRMSVAGERLTGGDLDRELTDLRRLERRDELERVAPNVVVVDAGRDAVDRAHEGICLGRMQRASRRACLPQCDELVLDTKRPVRSERVEEDRRELFGRDRAVPIERPCRSPPAEELEDVAVSRTRLRKRHDPTARRVECRWGRAPRGDRALGVDELGFPELVPDVLPLPAREEVMERGKYMPLIGGKGFVAATKLAQLAVILVTHEETLRGEPARALLVSDVPPLVDGKLQEKLELRVRYGVRRA